MAQTDNMNMKELYLSYDDDGQATERTNSSTSSVERKYSTKENCIMKGILLNFVLNLAFFCC